MSTTPTTSPTTAPAPTPTTGIAPAAGNVTTPDSAVVAPVDAAWLTLSAAMTDEVPPIADREDLLVSIAPGLGQGAPACFVPALARIEIDGTHLDVDPDTAAPYRGSGDRTRYGVAWGLLVHECAHARHTEWTPPPGAPPGTVAAATLLEETRIEAAQLRRRPDDRHWLRAAATRLILTDLTPPPTPTSTTTTPSAPPSGITSARTVPTPGPGDPVPAPGTAPGAGPGIPATALPNVSATGTAAPRAPVTAAPAAPGAGSPGAGSRADAARTAALILARADAGIFTRHEVAPIATEVRAVLGGSSLARLRTLWQTALTVADDDADTMIDLGRRWCEEVGIDPAQPARGSHACPATAPPPASSSSSVPGPGTPAPVHAGVTDNSPAPATATVDALATALAASVKRIELGVLLEAPPPEVRVDHVDRAEQRARACAEETGEKLLRRNVLASPGAARSSSATAITGTRAPSDRERSASRVLGRALDTAGIRDRVTIRTGSILPPGRLRVRDARAADAQRAAGAVPTAEPFVRTTRRPVPDPPLRLGVICDVSGSMGEFAEPVASTAWILAHAAHHARVPVSTATVIFGTNVRLIGRPNVAPPQVTEFACVDGNHAAAVAVDAIDGLLGLASPGAARLLVIISDGVWEAPRERNPAQARIGRLIAAGCGVLWLAPSGVRISPLRGATVHRLDDPADAARAIGRAATTALRAAR